VSLVENESHHANMDPIVECLMTHLGYDSIWGVRGIDSEFQCIRDDKTLSHMVHQCIHDYFKSARKIEIAVAFTHYDYVFIEEIYKYDFQKCQQLLRRELDSVNFVINSKRACTIHIHIHKYNQRIGELATIDVCRTSLRQLSHPFYSSLSSLINAVLVLFEDDYFVCYDNHELSIFNSYDDVQRFMKEWIQVTEIVVPDGQDPFSYIVSLCICYPNTEEEFWDKEQVLEGIDTDMLFRNPYIHYEGKTMCIVRRQVKSDTMNICTECKFDEDKMIFIRRYAKCGVI
jgi:hypothetical protein